MSTRVLGQYDLLITDEAPEDQDVVSYVGPNIVAVEEQYGFDPSEFRLWLALHEVTHRCSSPRCPGCATTSSPWSSRAARAARRRPAPGWPSW